MHDEQGGQIESDYNTRPADDNGEIRLYQKMNRSDQEERLAAVQTNFRRNTKCELLQAPVMLSWSGTLHEFL